MNGILHGGRLDETVSKYGGKRSDWLDLSTGINPNAYPVTDLPVETWEKLPDSGSNMKLMEAARKYYGAPDAAAIVAANGTQAIIQILPTMFPGKKVAILEPTYGEHANCWKLAGREITPISDVTDVGADKAEVVVVVNPNNPDGRRHEPGQLVKLATSLAKRGGVLIVDEAFCDVEPPLSIVPHMQENVIVLRSFGKFFGLAGIRLGFVLCNEALALRLAQGLGPWCVSGPALHIGSLALSDHQWISSSRAWIGSASKELVALLTDHRFDVTGNGGLFVEARHPMAATVFDTLLQRQILIRTFPDRPEFLRFGLCRDDRELSRLRVALDDFAGETR